MAKIDDVARHVVRGLEIVDQHRRVRPARLARAHCDRNGPGIGDQVEHALVVAQGRGEDEALDPAIDQVVDQRLGLGDILAILHDEVDVGAARLFQRSHQKLAKIGC